MRARKHIYSATLPKFFKNLKWLFERNCSRKWLPYQLQNLILHFVLGAFIPWSPTRALPMTCNGGLCDPLDPSPDFLFFQLCYSQPDYCIIQASKENKRERMENSWFFVGWWGWRGGRHYVKHLQYSTFWICHCAGRTPYKTEHFKCFKNKVVQIVLDQQCPVERAIRTAWELKVMSIFFPTF